MNRNAIICLFIYSLHFFPNLITSNPLAPALYVFGDSLYEVGNNNYLPTLAKVNYPPYGSNFNPVLFGRFTNGKVVPDFIAEYLRLPHPPPFLSIKDLSTATLTGVNYASGSCGVLPESGRLLGRCLQLSEQVDSFERTLTELKKRFPSSKVFSNYLSEAILLVNIGSNDYVNNYLEEKENSSKGYDPKPFAQLLAEKLSIQLKRIYDLGGRKIVVSELGPIGCIPHVTRKGNNHEKCDDKVNQMIVYFNSRLRKMLTNLVSTLEGSKFILVRTYDLSMELSANPSKEGDGQDLLNPCCNAWGDGTTLCIPLQTPCPNPEKNYYWDGYHPTESVYSKFASRCISDTEVCFPHSIEELLDV